MRISIRLSIFSTLLLLVFSVSLFIIAVNYFNLNSIFVTSAENYLNKVSSKTSEQIARYLDPLNDRAIIATKLIHSKTITPQNSEQFFIFLHDLIEDKEGIQAVKWADIQGNAFRFEKKPNGEFSSETIVNNTVDEKRIVTTYNAKMQPLDSKEISSDYDPRIRPWFQIAKFKKTNIWFIYPILHLSTNTTQLGIASASPIFKQDNSLLGVFSLEMPITTITDYVRQIKLTAKSVVFITDNLGNLITGFSANISLTNRNDMPKVKDIKMPWVEQAYNLYQQNRNQVFEFNYQDENYIAAFSPIDAPQGERQWFLGVITPLQDIIAPLQKNTLISLTMVIIGLLVGVFFANIVASSISKPINKLAQDSDLICNLELNQVTEVHSHITEVTHMATAFIKMKNVLQSFQRYMPTTLIKKLITTGKIAEIGGEIKELTIVYTDIENFTPLSENMLPTDLTLYLSEYFQTVVKVFIDHFGTVDKYLGDGVMAFWGAPIADEQHAHHACQAIIQLKIALSKLNEKWHTESKPQIATRIGVNTGKAVIGNIGSDDRLNYTVVGDAVNLASRLESLNKLYGTKALISEFTYNAVKDNFNCRLLDKVAVKGKKQEIFVYELLAAKTTEPNIALEQYNTAFALAFHVYTVGDWDNALALFNSLAAQHPEDHLLKIYIERCTNFQKQPPLNWNGTWVLSDK